MPLVLSRVAPEDFDTLVPIQFSAFAKNGAHYAQLGCKNPENIAHAKAIFLDSFASDPADLWLKVIDEDATGRIIAASNWKIYPTYVKSDFDTRAALFEGMKAEDVSWHTDPRQKEDAVTIVKEFFSTRYRRTREAHVCECLHFEDSALCLNVYSLGRAAVLSSFCRSFLRTVWTWAISSSALSHFVHLQRDVS